MILLGIFLFAVVLFLIINDWLFLKKDLTTINRLNMYKEIIVTQWSILILICIVWAIADFKLIDLFMIDSKKTDQHGFLSLFSSLQNTEYNFSFVAGFLTSVIVGGILLGFIMRKRAKKGLTKQPIVGNIDFLLPQTKRERITFIFVAFTAGICEEIVFRGAMAVFLLALPFEFSLNTVAIISAIIFGLAHYYQGIKGIIGTGILGFVFFNLYISSGSLLLPMILHIMIDLKFVFTPNGTLKEKKTIHTNF